MLLRGLDSGMLSPSEVLMTVAKECDRVLAAPKGALWTENELVVVWEGERPLRIPAVNKALLRNMIATLVHMNIARVEPSPIRFRRMLVTLARTFDGALKEWSELLLEEIKVGAE